ncbi:MAG TPA: hypothetical protein VHG51_01870 [Longimicrobiaceae bacterium]|nr:hypothetical protein [Longimicrobiaceae bacterium]
MLRQLSLAAAAAAAFVALPGTAHAQDFRATVVAQLDAAARPVTGNGFRADPGVFSRDVVVGALAKGTSSFQEINLQAGASYFIAAACDEDCSDMDLRLFASDSDEALAEDTKEDDYPMITFTAPKTGRYMLAVDMAACGESMCYYGYRVFKK